MLFNSLGFLIFLPVVFILYFVLPRKFRWILLLCASYYFYGMWNSYLLILIIGTTIISYICALGIEKTSNKGIKKGLLAFCIISNLLILFFFKYFNFFSLSVSNLIRLFGKSASDFTLNLLLPVGISFYTFQTFSYAIDVYRGQIKAERHLGYYALFVSFFPQLVAGPIERPDNLLPQLKQKHKIKKENLVIGFQYILIGFVKKVVIADTLARFVNIVYNNPSGADGLSVIIATVLFAVQILCDFDGYTNIAIGVAKLFGINLMKNFDNPYSATSIKGFWARWHISLSSWFKDYLYIPLGGNRKGKIRAMLNVLIVFIISGLWHGANWTFLIWGGLHGFYQIVGTLTKKPKPKLLATLHIKDDSKCLKLFRTVITFILVCFAWIFFRASSVTDAGILLTKIFTTFSLKPQAVENSLKFMKMSAFWAIGIVLLVLLLSQLCKYFIDRMPQFIMPSNTNTKQSNNLSKSPLSSSTLPREQQVAISYAKMVVYLLLSFAVVFAWLYLGISNGLGNAFIYFQF